MQQSAQTERHTRNIARGKFCPCPECAKKNRKEKRLLNHIWRNVRKALGLCECGEG